MDERRRDWRETERWLVGEAWTGSRISEHARQLCDVIGPRWASSGAELSCAEYIANQFASCGLTTQRQEFLMHTWSHGETKASLLPESTPIALVPYFRCPAFSVSAPAVDVGFGTPTELDRVGNGELRGVVAVMASGFRPFSDPVAVPDRLRLLAALGVAAVLVIDAKDGGRRELRWGHDMREDAFRDPPLPTATISREHGALLRHRAGATIEISVEAEFREAPTANVVAELPGERWPREHLIIGAHHDTVFGSPGGNDNASGVIAVLETARILGELCRNTGRAPGRAIRFVSFSAEEQSLQGSAAYVDANYTSGQMPEPRLAINLDELSTGYIKGLVLGFPHLRDLVQAQFDAMDEGLVCHVMPQLDGSSDHFPFLRAGIDAAHVWRWRFHGANADSLFHHEAADTADKINVRELKEHVGCLARLLLRLSDVPPDRWPRNDITAEDVRRQLERERPTVVRTM